jgi:hypothetical protein
LVIRCCVFRKIVYNQEVMRSPKRHAGAAEAANPSGGIRITPRRLHDAFRGQPKILLVLPVLAGMPRISEKVALVTSIRRRARPTG